MLDPAHFSDDPKQRVRFRRFALAGAGYAAALVLLVVACALGLIDVWPTFQIAASILALNAWIFIVLHGGLNEQFKDPSLTWLQILSATAILMMTVYHFDYDRGLMLVFAFVVLSFGVFRFTTWEFLAASSVILAAYAIVIGLLLALKPGVTNLQHEAFRWLALALALPCFSLVGGRISELRSRLKPTVEKLSTAVATIEQMGTYDRLTGLPNRLLFSETLARSIAKAERAKRRLALLVLDLDRFKNVNDTLGHGVGDGVLQETARRLLSAMRSGDLVARLGGDEFVLLVEDFHDTSDLAEVASKILASFKATFVVQGQDLALSPSIGICTYPDGGKNAETLVSNADIAMYRAKEQGRNRYCFYAAELNLLSQEHLSLQADLGKALENDEFEVWYQPKISLRDGRVTGAEALLRWRHPRHGLLTAGRFVPLAEEGGLIELIDLWTFRRVCERARKCHEDGIALPPVAVNLSATQFHKPDLADELARILADTGAAADWVELEITETTVMRDPDRAVQAMESLRNMGLQLAIDDFGMGHSSLGYLKRFPVNTLKIDRTFVRDLPSDGDDVAITRAIIAMAHSLRLTVVAEGVERQDQFDLLRAQSCDAYQGFLCQPALSEQDFLQFLADHPPRGRAVSKRREYAARSA